MIAKLKFLTPLIMAGAAATAIAAAPIAAAENYAWASSFSQGNSSVSIPESPGGDGCANGTCGGGGPQGGNGCTADGTCGHGGPQGGGGCVPGVGCFNYGT